MYSGKDLAELSGYTGRVYALLSSLHALNTGSYMENPRPASLAPGEVNDPFFLSYNYTNYSLFMTWQESTVRSSSDQAIFC